MQVDFYMIPLAIKLSLWKKNFWRCKEQSNLSFLNWPIWRRIREEGEEEGGSHAVLYSRVEIFGLNMIFLFLMISSFWLGLCCICINILDFDLANFIHLVKYSVLIILP